VTLTIRVDRDPILAGEEFGVLMATPPQARDKRADSEFVVAIDASLSMTWPAREGQRTTRWHLARQGALTLIASLDPNVGVHVLLFDGRSREIASGSAGALRTSLAGLLPKDLDEDGAGGTNIEDALTTSYRLLESSTAVSRRVVLLSDGEPTVGNKDANHLAMLASRAGYQDIYTEPVGLGADAKVDLLLRLSGTGYCDHVASRAEADRILGDVMRRLASNGQLVAARGGELRVEVSPFFTVVGVYQIHPARRICTDVVRRGDEDASVVAVQLGPVSPGDDGRVMFALKLRAPERTSSEPLELLRATADIRRQGGPAKINGPETLVTLTRDREGSPDSGILTKIRAVEFEAEVAGRLRSAAADKHEQIYQEAEQEARAAGLRELADHYRNALAGFGAGLAATDVFNEQRAATSRSTTRPDELLRARPVLPPSSRRRQSPPKPSFSDDEWSGDDWDVEPGAEHHDDRTERGDQW
jgi:von Willebrand factor type A domain